MTLIQHAVNGQPYSLKRMTTRRKRQEPVAREVNLYSRKGKQAIECLSRHFDPRDFMDEVHVDEFDPLNTIFSAAPALDELNDIVAQHPDKKSCWDVRPRSCSFYVSPRNGMDDSINRYCRHGGQPPLDTDGKVESIDQEEESLVAAAAELGLNAPSDDAELKLDDNEVALYSTWCVKAAQAHDHARVEQKKRMRKLERVIPRESRSLVAVAAV